MSLAKFGSVGTQKNDVKKINNNNQSNTESNIQSNIIVNMESNIHNRASEIEEKYNNMTKSEEVKTRKTFAFRNDLLERLNKISEGKHGFKSDFMNNALEAFLDIYEKKNK